MFLLFSFQCWTDTWGFGDGVRSMCTAVRPRLAPARVKMLLCPLPDAALEFLQGVVYSRLTLLTR